MVWSQRSCWPVTPSAESRGESSQASSPDSKGRGHQGRGRALESQPCVLLKLPGDSMDGAGWRVLFVTFASVGTAAALPSLPGTLQ